MNDKISWKIGKPIVPGRYACRRSLRGDFSSAVIIVFDIRDFCGELYMCQMGNDGAWTPVSHDASTEWLGPIIWKAETHQVDEAGNE
jgi:hypothetical protein